MTTTIQKWGNSQGIRIPKYILEAMNWTGSEQLSITTEKGKIIIERAKERPTLREMFVTYDSVYEPINIECGEPVGDEVW